MIQRARKINDVQVEQTWDGLFRDMNEEIARLKRQVAALRKSAKVCRRRADAGEPFPTARFLEWVRKNAEVRAIATSTQK